MPITIIMYILKNASVSDLITSYFPVLRRPLWFASSYIVLMVISPYLKNVFKLEKKNLESLIAIGFIVICVICSTSKEMDTYLDSIIWFMYVYICVGYYKKYISKGISRYRTYFLWLSIVIYSFLVILSMANLVVNGSLMNLISKLAAQYLEDYKSIPNFICAIALFIYFEANEGYTNKTINRIAAPTFAVYIIHQVPSFHDYLWFNILKVEIWRNSTFMPIMIILIGCLIFVISMITEYIRINCVEKTLINSKLYSKLELKLNKTIYLE